MKLVDKERLEKALNTLVNSGRISDGAYNEVWNKMKACLVSPAELAEILPEIRQASLKGKAWVLEELKKWLQEPAQESTKEALGKEVIEAMDSAFYSVLNKLETLESQAPVSELAGQVEIVMTEEEHQKADELMREDIKIKRKAGAWVTLSGIKAETKDKEPFVKEIKKMMQTIWDLQGELLAQEEKR